jgi:hypothetical protein
MFLRIAGAILSVLVTAQAFACDGVTLVPARTRVHDAVVIAEGRATREQYTFVLGRVWRGSASGTVAFTGDWIEHAPSMCKFAPPTEESREYLIFINDPRHQRRGELAIYPGEGYAVPLDSDAGRDALRFLENGVRVSRADVASMLRQWHAQKITDRALAAWLRKAELVDGEELAVHTLNSLDGVLNDDLPVGEGGRDRCAAFTRLHIVPYLLEVFETRDISEERVEQMEDEVYERFPEESEDCLW